ncbi:MAG: transglycosylase domain-containing protein [Kofleriaceae bacterium]
MTTRERRILVATAILAIGAPVGALAIVRDRTAALSDHLTDASGVPATIGSVDADLTGSVRLSDVAFGSLLSAETIQASVALDSLLSGDLRADEVQIASPRVAIEIDADGDSNLARLARRLAKRPDSSRPSPSSASSSTHARSPRVRRIVVSEGTLTARIAGVGEISADGVEIVPDTLGARVITGPLRVTSHGGPLPALANLDIELAFTRSAAEISLPEMKLGRVLAVGGTGSVSAGGKTTQLRDIAAGRLRRTHEGHEEEMDDSSIIAASTPSPTVVPIDIRATIDDAGVARDIAIEATPTLLLVAGEHIPLAGLVAIAPKSIVLDDAHASGTLRVSRERAALAVEADGSIDGLRLQHKTLAEVPIPVAAAIRTTARIGSDGLALERFELDMGAIHARASGHVHRGGAATPLSAQLDVAIDKAPCADMLASLPAEVRGPLDGIVLEGELGLASRLTIDLGAPAGDGAALVADFTGRCKTLAEPPSADVTSLAAPLDDDSFVAMDKIPARVQGAFVSAEDGRFWDHDGFDLQQIARSLEIDLRERRLARGGSTISQQLIKNSFLTHRRTLDRKIQEAVLTWRLEARLDKRQILERYLNIIELGPSVRGIGAASKFWFATTPKGLTTKQAAFLAAITSEPTSMSRRVRRRGGLDEVSAERVATILRAMRRDGVISSAEHDAARTQAMNFAPAAIRDDR